LGEGAKELIDAESLVRWAASKELPKLRHAGGFVFPPLHLLPDGELVGRWNVPAFYPEMSPMFAANVGGGSRAPIGLDRDPDDDALAVGHAVHALARNPPAIEGELELVTHGIGLDSPSGDGRPFLITSADAAGATAHARRNLAGLVLGCGALGVRPDWEAEPFKVAAVRAANGQAGVFRLAPVTLPTIDGESVTIEGEIRCQATRRGDYPSGAYCRLDYEPDPQRVVADRADYLIWRAALAELALKLSGRLARFEPLEPAAPIAPWITEGESP
jgi:hypothetical protein